MSIVLPSVGSVLCFDYPHDNRVGVRPKWDRRFFVVERRRDCLLRPVPKWATILRPDLRRGERLLKGRDLSCHDTRQFYIESMRDGYTVLDIPVSRLAYYNPEDDSTDLVFFGPIWTDSMADLVQMSHLRDYANAHLAADDDPDQEYLAVGLFPISATTRSNPNG